MTDPPEGFFIDKDTTDEFLDAPLLVYAPDGRGFVELMEEDGYDLSDLGTLAEQMEARGHRLPDLPPITEH
jgi:hypothetical protein